MFTYQVLEEVVVSRSLSMMEAQNRLQDNGVSNDILSKSPKAGKPEAYEDNPYDWLKQI